MAFGLFSGGLQSIISSFGTESLSGLADVNAVSGGILESIQVPVAELPSFDPYQTVSNFAGSAAWNDIVNPGRVIRQAASTFGTTAPAGALASLIPASVSTTVTAAVAGVLPNIPAVDTLVRSTSPIAQSLVSEGTAAAIGRGIAVPVTEELGTLARSTPIPGPAAISTTVGQAVENAIGAAAAAPIVGSIRRAATAVAETVTGQRQIIPPPRTLDTTVLDQEDAELGQAIRVNTDPLAGAAAEANAATSGLTDVARQQAVISAQRQARVANGDWRVRLSLATGSTYLYNAPNPGILQPLKVTDGVLFPYTPAISTAYKADYDSYQLTHSNYKGYFYRGSSVEGVNIKSTFTAQDTKEAEYILAVIHFFRSATKMFYGQDALRGAPPPLVYITGYGEFQFNNHPCLISSFSYDLPADVDYIRARSSFTSGTGLLVKRDRKSVASNPLSYALERLASVGLPKGAEPVRIPPPTLGTNSPTYVPTKISIDISLLPVQTRNQVSREFSLQNFANGNGLKGGFW